MACLRNKHKEKGEATDVEAIRRGAKRKRRVHRVYRQKRSHQGYERWFGVLCSDCKVHKGCDTQHCSRPLAFGGYTWRGCTLKDCAGAGDVSMC